MKTRRRLMLPVGLVAALITFASQAGMTAAVARIDMPREGETVRNRSHPEYDALGMTVGSMRLNTSIGVMGRYTDNQFYRQNNRQSDITLMLRPDINLRSNWSRHSFELRANGDFEFNEKYTTEDADNMSVSARGRIDISKDTNLTLGSSWRDWQEDRGAPDDQDGFKPTQYDETLANAVVRHRFGRFTLAVGGSYSRRNYKDNVRFDGALIENDDRDRDIFRLDGRLRYKVQDGLELFVQATRNWRRFDEPLNDGFQRNSQGIDVSGGIDLQLSNTVFGYFYVGYVDQNYLDPRFAEVNAVLFGGDIDWNVTPLTTINLRADRDLMDTVTFGSPGYLSDRVRLTIDHELRRNIIVTLEGMIGQNDFRQSPRDETVYNFGVRVEWQWNRHLALNVGYQHFGKDTSFAGVNEYKINQVTLGVTARY
jgi:hypothetical protein